MRPDRGPLTSLLDDVLADDDRAAERDRLLDACLSRLATAAAPARLLDDVLAADERGDERERVWSRLRPRSPLTRRMAVGLLVVLVLASGAWLLVRRSPGPSRPPPSAPPQEPPTPSPWVLPTRPGTALRPEPRVAAVVPTVPRSEEPRARPALAVVGTRPHPTLHPRLAPRAPLGLVDDDALLAMLPARGAALVSVGPGLKELRFVDPEDEARWIAGPR